MAKFNLVVVRLYDSDDLPWLEEDKLKEASAFGLNILFNLVKVVICIKIKTYLISTVITTSIDANVPSYVQTIATAKFKP